MGEMTDRAEQMGREAHESNWLDYAIRAGLVAYGVVHLLVGWLALQLAFGDSEGKASNKGAMQQLAQQPFGEVLVWAIAVGHVPAGHLAWPRGGRRPPGQGRGFRPLEGPRRLGDEGRHLRRRRHLRAQRRHRARKSSKGGSTWTKTVMEWPAGQWIVAAVGLAVIGYGANHVRKGFTDDYAKHLDAEGKSGQTGKAYLMFGKVGYIGKGIAIAIVGGLILYGGLTHDPKKSGSLDQALHKLLTYPFGQIMLVVVAAGIICYGLFCFARAKHLSPSDK